MKNQRSIFGKALQYSFIGLVIQILLAVMLYVDVILHRYALSLIGFWTACAGLPVWLHLIITYQLFRRETHWETALREGSDDSVKQKQTRHRGRIRTVHYFYRKFLVPVMEIGIIFLLIAWLFPFARFSPVRMAPVQDILLQTMSLFTAAVIGLIVVFSYYRKLLQFKSYRLLKSGVQFLFAMIFLLSLLLVCLLLEHLNVYPVSSHVYRFFSAFNCVLAAEIAFSIITQFFRPRRTNEMVRPAFDSYLLECIIEPHNTRKTVSAMAGNLFGFDISETTLVKTAAAYVLPVISASMVLLLLMSSLVIIEPHQQAVILSFGRLQNRTLNPGIRLKRPWPVDEARIVDVHRIRRIHVGSHQPAEQGGSVYREGIPILWTNNHGINMDELLIVASPRQLLREARKGGAKIDRATSKTPSISLAGADIYVEYTINNLCDYIRSAAAPRRLIKKLAEAQASRLLYCFDIDALFCGSRREIAEQLQAHVQNACDRYRLGVRIVHTGVTAVHPPLSVAKTFEATVSAQQERETDIQQAKQRSVSTQVETAGSSGQFAAFADIINRSESGKLENTASIEQLLYQCGGHISRTLSGALAYRWSRQSDQHGKSIRFKSESALSAVAPRYYRYTRYLNILEKGLADRDKTILLGSPDKVLIRWGSSKKEPDDWPDNPDNL